MRPPDGDSLLVRVDHTDFAVSPDGKTIAFVGEKPTGNVYLRSVDDLEVRPLMIAEASDRVLRSPFFSPDGEWLGVYVTGELLLKKVSVSSGFTTTIGRLRTGLNEASWGDDGTIVFSANDGFLYAISSDGGEPELLSSLAGSFFRDSPQLLPGGKHLLFNEAGDAWKVVVLDLETGQRKTLLEQGRRARYVATGHLVFGANGVLWVAPFDLGRLEFRGEAVSLIQNVRPDFAVSNGETLAYIERRDDGRRILVWVDREGREEPLPVEPGGYARPRISPDGGRIAFERDGDIWIHDVEQQTSARLTFDPAVDINPLWTPDGTLYFSSRNGEAERNCFRRRGTGVGKPSQSSFRGRMNC